VANLYGPILTGVGLLENGKLTTAARQRYVTEVIALLATGNAGGKGGSPTTQIFSNIVPLPPISGPTIPNVTTLSKEPLFWFGPDPLAALMATFLVDKNASPTWNSIFPDLLYTKTAEALDANGSTPLFPMFDVSAAFDIDVPLPFALPDLAVKLKLDVPKLSIKLADLGIKLAIPSIPPIPTITLPNLMPPSLPGIPSFPLPSLALPDLLLGLIKLPFDLLLKLVFPPNLGLVLNLPGLPKVVLDLAIDIVLKLITPVIPIVPKVFIASLLIYMKDVVAMVCVDIVGMLVGAGGSMTKLMAGLTGLM